MKRVVRWCRVLTNGSMLWDDGFSEPVKLQRQAKEDDGSEVLRWAAGWRVLLWDLWVSNGWWNAPAGRGQEVWVCCFFLLMIRRFRKSFSVSWVVISRVVKKLRIVVVDHFFRPQVGSCQVTEQVSSCRTWVTVKWYPLKFSGCAPTLTAAFLGYPPPTRVSIIKAGLWYTWRVFWLPSLTSNPALWCAIQNQKPLWRYFLCRNDWTPEIKSHVLLLKYCLWLWSLASSSTANWHLMHWRWHSFRQAPAVSEALRGASWCFEHEKWPSLTTSPTVPVFFLGTVGLFRPWHGGGGGLATNWFAWEIAFFCGAYYHPEKKKRQKTDIRSAVEFQWGWHVNFGDFKRPFIHWDDSQEVVLWNSEACVVLCCNGSLL